MSSLYRSWSTFGWRQMSQTSPTDYQNPDEKNNFEKNEVSSPKTSQGVFRFPADAVIIFQQHQHESHKQRHITHQFQANILCSQPHHQKRQHQRSQPVLQWLSILRNTNQHGRVITRPLQKLHDSIWVPAEMSARFICSVYTCIQPMIYAKQPQVTTASVKSKWKNRRVMPACYHPSTDTVLSRRKNTFS